MMLRLLLLMLIAWPVLAVDPYEFSSEENRQQFQQLSAQLRCPKCINQNLIGSDAEIAGDLRRELYEQIEAGKSSEEIVDFMVQRYGQFVNYDTPYNKHTKTLWIVPKVFLGLGICIIVVLLLMRSNTNKPLTAKEQKALDAILKEDTELP